MPSKYTRASSNSVTKSTQEPRNGYTLLENEKMVKVLQSETVGKDLHEAWSYITLAFSRGPRRGFKGRTF